MLGKIIDGVLTYPPNRIVLNGMQIFNPTEEQLLSVGYKPIVETDMPDDAPVISAVFFITRFFCRRKSSSLRTFGNVSAP